VWTASNRGRREAVAFAPRGWPSRAVPTALLYHADSTQLSFEATVVGHAPGAVILDRTAFYAEGGGQLADHGTLAGLPVTDVQIDDAGVVRHLVVGELPAVGATVSGQIDRARRRQYSALHTAQHMLSRALIEVAHAETVSARLGESSCTVDLDVPSLGEAEVARAEALVNTLVEDDVSIRAWFPEASELASLPLRRRPKVSENVRVVAIGDFDVSPCGGTHCTQSAQVGLLEVTGMERYKGMMRVSFAAGRRARVLLESEAAVLRGLARTFTCGPLDVPAAVDKLRQALSASDARAEVLAARAAVAIAAELVATGADPVVATLEGADVGLLRLVASQLSAAGRAGILGASVGEGLAVLVSRPTPATAALADAGATLRALAQAAGGKGGGRGERAEGRLPAGTDLVALAARLLGS
jgi:alanyl-tRNA synthetase